jgi:hypothetical protein
MTEDQVRAVGPAFARFPGGFERFFDPRSVEDLRNYCRRRLSHLPRKSVEPIALAAGTAVRTLQEFLVTVTWDHAARQTLHRRTAEQLAESPADPLGAPGPPDGPDADALARGGSGTREARGLTARSSVSWVATRR